MSLLKKSNKRSKPCSLHSTAQSMCLPGSQAVNQSRRPYVPSGRSNGGVVIQAVASKKRGESEIAEAGKRDMSQLCGAT